MITLFIGQLTGKLEPNHLSLSAPLLVWGSQAHLLGDIWGRDITLPTKVHLVKAMVFPVVMYGCESWTVKKAECWRIDAFELWCWRKLLRVPWTARRGDENKEKLFNLTNRRLLETFEESFLTEGWRPHYTWFKKVYEGKKKRQWVYTIKKFVFYMFIFIGDQSLG